LKNFEFTTCWEEAIHVSIVSDRFSFNNLSINIDPHYCDASIYKVLNQSIFAVDVIGISDNENLPYTCTLFLTDDHRARISIVGNQTFCKLILNAINDDDQCFRLIIFNATLLEEYCFKLLRGSSSRNFVTTIDIFKFEERPTQKV
jgi:hypothetical protein